MGEIVAAIGVPHTPLLWHALQAEPLDDLGPVAANFERCRELIRRSGAEALVMVASDHFRALSTAVMPAFMIGKGPNHRVTHPNEIRGFGIPEFEVPGDPELARCLLGGAQLTDHIDFAFSDEIVLDHAFAVPLLYLRPENDLPVVPVFTNATAPPLPGARRFADLGRYLRQAVERWEGSRVAVVASAHLATEIGGPRHFSGGSPDPDFDRQAVRWLADGDLDGAVAGATFERMMAAGNVTHQYLNLLTCLAAAGDLPPVLAEGTLCRFGNEPFFAWAAS